MNRFLISSVALILSLSPVNADTAPAGSDKTITVVAGSTYTFTDADWGFTDSGDSPPHNFSAVKLTSLPNAGTFQVDGVSVSGSPTVTRQSVPTGATWTARNSSRNWLDVASSADGTKLIAAEYDGLLYSSTDSGFTWTARESSRRWLSVASSSDGTRLVAGAYGHLYTSTDSGLTWTVQMTDSDRWWYAVASSADGTKLVAAEEGGLLYTSTDSGVTWTPRITGVNRDWRSVASSADGTKLVAASSYTGTYDIFGGYLFTSTDSGVTWTARMTDINRKWQSVASSVDGTKLVAAVYGGLLYTSTNSGVTWTARMTDINRNWRSVASSADGMRLVAATDSSGLIYTSLNSGLTWTEQSSGSRYWTAVASSADGTKLVASVSGGQLYTSTNSIPIIRYTAPLTAGQQSFAFQVQDDGQTNRLDLSPNTITLDVIAPPTVTTPISADVTDNSAILGGNVISDGALAITERGVVYSVTAANPNPQIGGAGVTKVAATGFTGVFTVTVSGLAASTGYSFAAFATNSLGTTYTTPTSAFTTSVAPAGSDKTITIKAGTTYTFTDEDWGFTDTDTPPNYLFAVKLTSLPAAGTLKLDGVNVSGSPMVTRLPRPVGVVWTARMADRNRYWGKIASSADGTKLVATVYGGQLYTSTDSGVTWTARMTDSDRGWSPVASSEDGTKLVAAVYGGQLYTSTDSGVTWTARESNRSWSSLASSADGTKLLAAVDEGQLYTSTDSGVTWTARGTNGGSWRTVASSADGTKLVAAKYSGLLYTSTDSGVTWTARDIPRPWWSVASSADGMKLVAALYQNQLYTSTDSGVTWTARESNRWWRSVASSADGIKLVAVEETGLVFTSMDSGVTWAAQTMPASDRRWNSVASSADGAKLAAVVQDGLPYTSVSTSAPVISYAAPITRGQQSFTFQVQDDGAGNNLDLSPNTITLNVVSPPALFNPTSANITSSGATLGGNVTTDGGSEITERGVVYSAWTTNNTPQIGGTGVTQVTAAGNTGVFTVAVSGLTGSTNYAFAAYATNSLGTAYSMVSNFFTLSAPPAGTDKTITVAAGATYTFTNADWGFTDIGDSSPNNFVAVKLLLPPAAGILQVDGQGVSTFPITTPTSSSWTARMTDRSRSWRSVTSSADGTKLFAVESNFLDGGQLYISTNSGASWMARASSRQWSSVASSADGTKLIAADSGVFNGGLLYTSTDSGVTWTARITDSVRYWNSVASSADGTKLVAADSGFINGGLLYTSTDSGVTWTARMTDSVRYWNSVASSADGTKLIAADWGFFNGGLLYTSTDSGVTWTARMTDTNRAWASVAGSADGSKLVAAESGGKLYTSTDSGVTWTARMPDGTWFSVASSADGSKLLAANNGGQLYVSTNSGMTWSAQDFNRNWQSVAISADGSKLVAAEYDGKLYTSTGDPAQVISYTAPMTLGQQSFTFQVQDDGAGNNLDLSPNTITFNVTTLIENWRQTHFGSTLNIGTAADTGDFDADGVSNLLEFAFGTQPASIGNGRASLSWSGTFAAATFGSTGQPIAAVEGSGSNLEYRALFTRRTDYASAGLTYTVQFTNDFTNWVNSTDTPSILSSSGGYDLVSVPYPAGVNFFRLNVTLTP
jgi:photosystem II stability/assembly factor-like uncharacterized protein